MKKEMMVDVIVRVQRRQREPDKCWRKMAVADAVPQQRAPANVVIPIEIATANRFCRELKIDEHPADQQGAEKKMQRAITLIDQFKRVGFSLSRLFDCEVVRELVNFLHGLNSFPSQRKLFHNLAATTFPAQF